MAEKLVKLVEYIGPKEVKRYYSNLYSEHVEFKANDDFGGKKVAVVDVNIAEELLRFPAVYREIEMREFAGEKVKGGNQEDLYQKKDDADVADSEVADAIKKNREKINKKAKKK